MIVSRIRGGLGNQLFTYAILFAIAEEYHLPARIDNYIYETTYKLRQFKLLNYNISYNKCFIKRHPKNNAIDIFMYKVWNNIKRRLLRMKLITETKEFSAQRVQINPKKNYYFNGYWQSYIYFEKYREQLKKEYTLKNIGLDVSNMASKIVHEDCCAIHVRHGDYIHFQGGKCLDLSYYTHAIDTIRKNNPKCKFYIFTDDSEFCEKEFSYLDSVEHISKYRFTDEEELFLMSQCKYLIIANSSFSWWAAFLNSREGNITICPVVDMWKKEFYLNNWIKYETTLKSYK